MQWIAFLVTLVPFIELRGGILLAVAAGYDPALAFVVCVLLNILIIPLAFAILDVIVPPLRRRSKTARRLYGWAVSRVKKHEGLSMAGLAIFVGVPLPGTGAYAGALLADLIGMERKKAALAIAIGVVIAGALLWLLAVVGLFFVKGLTPP
ncbi:MAG: small multi-drug export protein [Candidatus Hadarchaeota archaeon]